MLLEESAPFVYMEKVLDQDLSYRSDRTKWRLLHRFARGELRRIGISRLYLYHEVSFQCSFHPGYHIVAHIPCRMDKRVLARAVDSILNGKDPREDARRRGVRLRAQKRWRASR
jgi:hypothetical protein